MTWLHAVIDVPATSHERTARFWSAALGWPVSEPWPHHYELRSFEPSDGDSYVHLQRAATRPRIHLDIESQEPGSVTSHALAYGARFVADRGDWRTLVSPGGLPFCVIGAREHTAPGPVRWPDGHRSRLVQVCIDSPEGVHDDEVTFWTDLLWGRWAPSHDSEFAGKWHDDEGSPLQLLFQRLEEADGPVRAHLDLGTDAMAAEVARLLAIGASDRALGRGWHTLGDVNGESFCVTGNSPAQTLTRRL